MKKMPMPMPAPSAGQMPAAAPVQSGRGPVPIKSHNPANHISNMPTVGGAGGAAPMPVPPGRNGAGG